ncbi:MAG TPA: hypothetical protein VFK13_05495 [Gemmatimonadaceae bacterium]|nr:hypothetical protein [Gemmatimonadaceae bacterium]
MLLLLFAVMAGDQGTRQFCPTHGLHSMAAMPGADAHAGHAGSHQMPGHDAGYHGCTCIGSCTIPVAAASPVARVELVATIVIPARADIPTAARPALPAPALLLPYAHAPPPSLRVA